jgi:hypothetical protein
MGNCYKLFSKSLEDFMTFDFNEKEIQEQRINGCWFNDYSFCLFSAKF